MRNTPRDPNNVQSPPGSVPYGAGIEPRSVTYNVYTLLPILPLWQNYSILTQMNKKMQKDEIQV